MISLQDGVGVVSSWLEESHMSTNLNVNEFNDEKIHCSLNADSGSSPEKYEPFSEMVKWVRRAALDPCNKKNSIKTLQSRRMLKVRKVLRLNTSKLPWKKRKFSHLLQETSRATADFSLEKSNEQHLTGLDFAQSPSVTSVPCLISSDSAESFENVLINPCNMAGVVIHGENLSRKRVFHGHSFLKGTRGWSSSPGNELPMLLISDDSRSGSNPKSPSKPILQTRQVSDQFLNSGSNDSVELVDISSSYQTESEECSQSNNYCPSLDSVDSAISSNSSSPVKPKRLQTPPRRSRRLRNFIGDYPTRIPIPVGAGFQAEIPDWAGASSYNGDDNWDTIKWLGTQVWPIEGRKTTGSEVIGKGRSCSCTCDSLGSIKCVKRHIVEKGFQLRAEIGPAFFIWGFNEMGEEVSRSWTEKDQNNFEVLVKTNSTSRKKSFLKPALNYFTSKCRQGIMSYYYNVYVPRRLSKQTRMASAYVDSDDDGPDGNVGYSKLAKTRYLIRRR